MKWMHALRRMYGSMVRHHPLVEVRIFREHILHNLHEYQIAAPHSAIAPVLKSNAYGHGLFEVARILEKENVPFIVVDALFEARIIRGEGIRMPLLVIGYTPDENVTSLPRDTAIAVGTLSQLKTLAASGRRVTIHLKVDTGMHRQGIMLAEVDEAMDVLARSPNLSLQGLCSHFADADSDDSSFTEKQIAAWNNCARRFKDTFPTLQYTHIAATAGIRYGTAIDANVGRLGKGLYGVNPYPKWDRDLKPALEMKAVISALRTLPKGERIGYNGTYATEKECRIATVPVGYYEGVDRRLSSKGFFLVRGIPCPIVGRVSMNISSIDVSAVPDARVGEEVIVVSANRSAPNSVESIAELCDTITYDIVVRIPAHLSRVVV